MYKISIRYGQSGIIYRISNGITTAQFKTKAQANKFLKQLKIYGYRHTSK